MIEATESCFVNFRAVIRKQYRPVDLFIAQRAGRELIYQREVSARKLCYRRWRGLLLACKTSYGVARGADAERRAKIGYSRYWHQGAKWNAQVKRYKIVVVGEERMLKEVEDDTHGIDADVRTSGDYGYGLGLVEPRCSSLCGG